VQDGFCHLVGRERVNGDGHVCRAVEREASLVASGEVGLIGENGTYAFGADAAGEGGGKFDLKVNEQRCRSGEEQVARFGTLDRASAKRQHKAVGGCKSGNRGVFALAEGRFAVPGKYLCDFDAGFLFNYIVDVYELPA